MWLCLNCGITMTDDEADNQMAEYDATAPCCCGGSMVREDNPVFGGLVEDWED